MLHAQIPPPEEVPVKTPPVPPYRDSPVAPVGDPPPPDWPKPEHPDPKPDSNRATHPVQRKPASIPARRRSGSKRERWVS